ncbi:MAG TPA: GtrA family protein [Bryobacteraceae bacterium]|nr:GtrA family protein [Bryobacteraceae bacterium]
MNILALRWLKFNFVGGLGIVVQLACLALFQRWMNYLPATALAVETAVLHNFAWHERFTWKDRPGGPRQRLLRLLRFHLANGALSVFGNLAFMWLLVGQLHMRNHIVANAIAIAILSILNFVLGEWFVFRK